MEELQQKNNNSDQQISSLDFNEKGNKNVMNGKIKSIGSIGSNNSMLTPEYYESFIQAKKKILTSSKFKQDPKNAQKYSPKFSPTKNEIFN